MQRWTESLGISRLEWARQHKSERIAIRENKQPVLTTVGSDILAAMEGRISRRIGCGSCRSRIIALDYQKEPHFSDVVTMLMGDIGGAKELQPRPAIEIAKIVEQFIPRQSDPFTAEPILHFGAHLWPTKDTWQWHVNLWNQMPLLVNGQCFVGVATDANTETFETIRNALHPSIICKQFDNTKEGENLTFRWLQQVVPRGQNDVLIYCHGKGAQQHTAHSPAVRRWTEAMYSTVVFNFDMIREKMKAGFLNVHSFRTWGKRPLRLRHGWHPSGTFFAVRAKHLSGKPVQADYGGVEKWSGDHFRAWEAHCEFFDDSIYTTLYDEVESVRQVQPALTEWWRVQKYERSKMCSTWGRNFVHMLPEGSVKDRDVLEVGAYDVNGSCRPLIMQQLPSSYVGTDMQAGPGVDVVCKGEDLPKTIGTECKDLIICTEVLEHVEDWHGFLASVWSVLRTNGTLLLTTRSPGFPLHNYPSDHWRFTVRDMLTIFEDQDILTVTSDPTSDPGVGVIVRKLQSQLTYLPVTPAPTD